MSPAQYGARRLKNHAIFLIVVVILFFGAGAIREEFVSESEIVAEQKQAVARLALEIHQYREELDRPKSDREVVEEAAKWRRRQEADPGYEERALKAQEEEEAKWQAKRDELRNLEKNIKEYKGREDIGHALTWLSPCLLVLGVMFSCLVMHVKQNFDSGQRIGS